MDQGGHEGGNVAVTDEDVSEFAPSGKERPFRRVVLFITFIVLLEALALCLKAYDDRLRHHAASETISRKDAAVVSEHVSGQISVLSQLLQLGYESAWSPSQVSQRIGVSDLVGNLTETARLGPGSRERLAAEAAADALSRGEIAVLTATDDLVIVSSEGSSNLFALLPAQRVLPRAQPHDTLFDLRPGGSASETEPGRRVVCSSVPATNFKSCVATPAPVVASRDLFNILVYILLLIAPTLGLAGLLDLARQARKAATQHETSARWTAHMLSTTLRETKTGLWSVNMTRGTIWLNAQAATLLGVAYQKHYSFRTLSGLINLNDHDTFPKTLDALKNTEELDQIISSKDRTRWFHLRGHPTTDGNEYLGVLMDVSEAQYARHRSQNAEQHLQSALEGLTGPFALWDPHQKLIHWNSAFARAFNLEDTLRPGIRRQTVALAQAASIIDRQKRSSDQTGEIVKVANGRWYKILERETVSGDLVTIGFDVTIDIQNEVEQASQQKRLHRLVMELEQSEIRANDLADKLRDEKIRAENSANSKSAFLANMSHELRTPLNAINGFSEILCNEMYGPLGSPRYREYARDILSSGQHLLDMINDILDMAKIEAGKMVVDLRPIDIMEPVDAAVRMIRQKAEEKGIQLSLVAGEKLPRVDADHRAVKQMVLNLLSNAIKFTNSGGNIRVSVDCKGQELRVAVRDTGVGIPAKALPRIARPFEQISETRGRNYDGTGLGLALTRSFAELQGGRLTIASEEQKGTQASFYLPLRAEGAAPSIHAA